MDVGGRIASPAAEHAVAEGVLSLRDRVSRVAITAAALRPGEEDPIEARPR